MRIAIVLIPLDEKNLQLAAQIGADEVVLYGMHGMTDSLDELLRVRRQIEKHGLGVSVVEGGPRMDQIVIPKPGRDAQIEAYKRALDLMGRAGIKILCYNFMPWSLRVTRTSYQHPARGGALTSAFDRREFDDAQLTADGTTHPEQMWESLEYFLRRVVPAAEAAGVKLALHPDDPPLPSLCGLSRIFSSVESFERLVSLVPSPCNGITFCQGCFAEMGADIPATIRRLRSAIHFAHFRDITGTADNFVESFHDNGKTDMVAAMRAYHEIGFSGPIRPDHVPLLAGEEEQFLESPTTPGGKPVGPATGYTMQGRIFAVGYMRGLMHAIAGHSQSVKTEKQ